MADPIKLEIGSKDIVVPADFKTDLKNFKTDVEKEITLVKQKSTIAEAQKLLSEKVSFDNGDFAFQVGDLIYKFPEKDFLEQLSDIKSALIEAELTMRRQKDDLINQTTPELNNLSDTVKDKTSSEIDFSKKIKEKSWLGSFLTGTTTLEQAIDDKNETELEAFRKTLLKALVKGKDEYEKVLQNGGEATFNKKEWYTLQFIEANKDLLSKKDSKIDWRAVKDAYGRGLENGEPTGGAIPVVEKQSPTKEVKENKETKLSNIEWSQDGIPTFSSLEDVRLYLVNQEGQNNQEEEMHLTRREKKVLNLTGKLQNQSTEEGKLNVMKKMAKISTKKRKLEEQIQKEAIKAGANTIAAHEFKNQTWYYNDIIANITKKNGRTSYTNDCIVIETYNPLFCIKGGNEKGILRLKCNPNDPNSVIANALRYSQGVNAFQEKNPDFYTPKGDMKGLFQAGTDWLGNNTNMTPKQAEFWNGAFKIGSVVGLGYVGWNILKGVFGKEGTKVFGRAKKKGEGWAWLGGTVGATMLMQSMTSENPFSFAYKLFNGGLDSKNFEKIPRLKQFTDKLKVNPALNDYMKYGAGMSMLFPGTSFGDIVKQGGTIEWTTDGKIKTNKASLLAFYTQRIANPNTSAADKEAFKIAMQNLNSMNDQQLNTVVAGGLDAAGIKDKTAAQQIIDYNKTWKEYMEQQEKAAKEIKNETIKSLVPPTITPETKAALKANGSKELTDEEAVKLQLALIELQKKDKNAVLIFTDKNGLILRTRNGDVPVKVGLDGKWQVAGFDKALFAEPSHALNIAAVTAFFINNFKGKQTSEDNPWSIRGKDLDFGKQTAFSNALANIPILNKIVGSFNGNVQALDGADLFSSSMKELGGDVFESNIGAYAEYLNGLKKNGISIWKKDGGLTTTAQIDGFIPERKKAVVEATPGSTPTTKEPTATNPDTKETPSNTQPGTTPEKKEPVVDVNDKATVLNEKTPEFTPEDIALGDQWYEKYNHKDGGDKTGKNPVERNKTFFYIWAKSFHQNTPYFTVDAYGTIGSSKGIQYGIIYERPVGGEIAPKRIKLQTGWYGHNTKVNDKPE